LYGGFGSAVLEVLADNKIICNVLRLGIPDKFIEHGSRTILLEKLGLTANGITKKVEQFLKKEN
ncbi:hypothetical protein KAX35_09455, partial [candidate division WOR-3 bacterium]|nr:hypothetical protein [candidate division WOR-3 bacterium]